MAALVSILAGSSASADVHDDCDEGAIDAVCRASTLAKATGANR
jgi:hypothetical protein